MSYFKRLKRVLAGLVALTFFVTNTFTQAPVAHAMPPSRQAQTVEPMSQLISKNSFKIPAEFGKVTDIIPVSPSDDIRHTTYDGQLIIHIQEAHANYDAQKNIRSILQYLSQNYGIQLVLLEGAGNKLQPELFNFFPKDAELQQAVNEKLLQAGELTGAEVFLIDNDQENRDSSLGSRDSEKQGAREGIRTSPESRVPRPAPHAEAWGVENAAAYATDREAYKKVYEGRGTADRFLQDAYLEWQKQASLILPKELRDFLGRFVSYEEERLPLPNWLETLKDAALKNLKLETSKDHSVIPAQAGIQAGSPIKTFGDDKTRRSRMANEGSPLDLTDVRAQIQWPVLVRYFRLRELDGKIDAASAESEKEAFLKNIQKLEIRDPGLVKTRNQNKSLVPGTVLQDVSEIFEAAKKDSLPVYKTRFVFERLMDALPDDFSFDPYPNLRLQIQQMILMSEIQGDDLQSEIKELTAKIVEASVKKDEEKALVRALREYRLLTKLFHLELSRKEYQQIQSRGITPGKLFEGLQTRDKRPETKSEGLKSEVSSLKSLFKEALDFYQGAVEREDVMMKRVREVMAERKETKAVLITGGFHTDGFKQKAVAAGSSYIQITPNIGAITPEDQRNYLRALLGPETRDKRQQTKTGFAPVSSLQSPVFERSEIAANPVEDASFMARVSRRLLAERLAHVLDIGRSEIRALRNDSPTALTELNTGIKNIIASAVGRSETRIELLAKPQLEKGGSSSGRRSEVRMLQASVQRRFLRVMAVFTQEGPALILRIQPPAGGAWTFRIFRPTDFSIKMPGQTDFFRPLSGRLEQLRTDPQNKEIFKAVETLRKNFDSPVLWVSLSKKQKYVVLRSGLAFAVEGGEGNYVFAGTQEPFENIEGLKRIGAIYDFISPRSELRSQRLLPMTLAGFVALASLFMAAAAKAQTVFPGLPKLEVYHASDSAGGSVTQYSSSFFRWDYYLHAGDRWSSSVINFAHGNGPQNLSGYSQFSFPVRGYATGTTGNQAVFNIEFKDTDGDQATIYRVHDIYSTSFTPVIVTPSQLIASNPNLSLDRIKEICFVAESYSGMPSYYNGWLEVQTGGLDYVPEVPPVATISGIHYANGSADITFSSNPGDNYRIDYRNDLKTGDWQPAGTVTATGTTTTFNDPNASSAKRFYRVFSPRSEARSSDNSASSVSGVQTPAKPRLLAETQLFKYIMSVIEPAIVLSRRNRKTSASDEEKQRYRMAFQRVLDVFMPILEENTLEQNGKRVWEKLNGTPRIMFLYIMSLAYRSRPKERLVWMAIIASLIQNTFPSNIRLGELLYREMDAFQSGNSKSASVESFPDAQPEVAEWARSFTRPGRLQRYLFFTTILRMMTPYNIMLAEAKAPLESVISNNAFYHLDGYLYTPFSGSFRRHLVGIEKNGTAPFWSEIKQAGEDKGRDLIHRSHVAIPLDLKRSSPWLAEYVPKPQAVIEAKGLFWIYGQVKRFTDDNPLRLVVYDYQDGRRLLHDFLYYRLKPEGAPRLAQFGYSQSVADRLKIDRSDLWASVAFQTAVIAKGILDAGYVGENEAGSDWHLENFKLLPNGRVMFVGDWGAFEKTKKPLREDEKRKKIFGLLEPIADGEDLESVYARVPAMMTDLKEDGSALEMFTRRFYSTAASKLRETVLGASRKGFARSEARNIAIDFSKKEPLEVLWREWIRLLGEQAASAPDIKISEKQVTLTTIQGNEKRAITINFAPTFLKGPVIRVEFGTDIEIVLERSLFAGAPDASRLLSMETETLQVGSKKEDSSKKLRPPFLKFQKQNFTVNASSQREKAHNFLDRKFRRIHDQGESSLPQGFRFNALQLPLKEMGITIEKGKPSRVHLTLWPSALQDFQRAVQREGIQTVLIPLLTQPARSETRVADKVIVPKKPAEEVWLPYEDGVTVLLQLMEEGKPYKIGLYDAKRSAWGELEISSQSGKLSPGYTEEDYFVVKKDGSIGLVSPRLYPRDSGGYASALTFKSSRTRAEASELLGESSATEASSPQPVSGKVRSEVRDLGQMDDAVLAAKVWEKIPLQRRGGLKNSTEIPGTADHRLQTIPQEPVVGLQPPVPSLQSEKRSEMRSEKNAPDEGDDPIKELEDLIRALFDEGTIVIVLGSGVAPGAGELLKQSGELAKRREKIRTLAVSLKRIIQDEATETPEGYIPESFWGEEALRLWQSMILQPEDKALLIETQEFISRYDSRSEARGGADSFSEGFRQRSRVTLDSIKLPGGKELLAVDLHAGKISINDRNGNLHILDHGVTVNVISAVFSPDGRQVVTGASNGTARLWDVQTGSLLKEFHHGGNLVFAGFVNGGKLIVTVSQKNAQLYVWDSLSGTSMASLEVFPEGFLKEMDGITGQEFMTFIDQQDSSRTVDFTDPSHPVLRSEVRAKNLGKKNKIREALRIQRSFRPLEKEARESSVLHAADIVKLFREKRENFERSLRYLLSLKTPPQQSHPRISRETMRALEKWRGLYLSLMDEQKLKEIVLESNQSAEEIRRWIANGFRIPSQELTKNSPQESSVDEEQIRALQKIMEPMTAAFERAYPQLAALVNAVAKLNRIHDGFLEIAIPPAENIEDKGRRSEVRGMDQTTAKALSLKSQVSSLRSETRSAARLEKNAVVNEVFQGLSGIAKTRPGLEGIGLDPLAKEMKLKFSGDRWETVETPPVAIYKLWSLISAGQINYISEYIPAQMLLDETKQAEFRALVLRTTPESFIVDSFLFQKLNVIHGAAGYSATYRVEDAQGQVLLGQMTLTLGANGEILKASYASVIKGQMSADKVEQLEKAMREPLRIAETPKFAAAWRQAVLEKSRSSEEITIRTAPEIPEAEWLYTSNALAQIAVQRNRGTPEHYHEILDASRNENKADPRFLAIAYRGGKPIAYARADYSPKQRRSQIYEFLVPAELKLWKGMGRDLLRSLLRQLKEKGCKTVDFQNERWLHGLDVIAQEKEFGFQFASYVPPPEDAGVWIEVYLGPVDLADPYYQKFLRGNILRWYEDFVPKINKSLKTGTMLLPSLNLVYQAMEAHDVPRLIAELETVRGQITNITIEPANLRLVSESLGYARHAINRAIGSVAGPVRSEMRDLHAGLVPRDPGIVFSRPMFQVRSFGFSLQPQTVSLPKAQTIDPGSWTINEVLKENREFGGSGEKGFRRVTREITDGFWSLVAHTFNAVEVTASFFGNPTDQASEKPDVMAQPRTLREKGRAAAARTALGIKTTTASDGYVLGEKLAFGDKALLAMNWLFGDAPVVILGDEASLNADDRVLLGQVNAQLKAASRTQIRMAKTLEEARAFMNVSLKEVAKHRNVGTLTLNLKAMANVSETSAMALKQQLGDNVILVTSKRVQIVLDLAGITTMVDRRRAEYLATAESA